MTLGQHRVAWTALALALLPAAARTQPAGRVDPHVDGNLLPAGCPACHVGHGVSNSPMLSEPQKGVCLRCHGTRADLDEQARQGKISRDARPPLLASLLAGTYSHPVSEHALSSREANAVACTSCHSPHRGYQEARTRPDPPGRRLFSTRGSGQFEYELCESCHGSRGATSVDIDDISRRLSPQNRSYHPVEAPGLGRSHSVVSELQGREINCSDCHGNSDPQGPRGPHGSEHEYLLKDSYPTQDGGSESPQTYALCYRCHDRRAILAFPEHRRHVVELRASCASCHDAHGSVGNPALIRFGEEARRAVVAPSGKAGRLAFVSGGSGSGACYLTCHGHDHAPESYGAGALPVLP